MGRKEQSLSVEKALAMIRRSNVCKDELYYVIQNVTGPGADEVRREAEALLPYAPSYEDQVSLQLAHQ